MFFHVGLVKEWLFLKRIDKENADVEKIKKDGYLAKIKMKSEIESENKRRKRQKAKGKKEAEDNKIKIS